MVLSNNAILTAIGINTAAQRTVVSEDLIPNPDRLENLLSETESGIEDACNAYNRGDNDRRFRLSRVTIKRLISLMHWAKDKHRVNEDLYFPNRTDDVNLLAELQEATIRENCRKIQRKTGESLITTDFVIKLKNSSQWDRWSIELKSVLSSIIGAKGIPLTYVIRENEDPGDDSDLNWTEKFEANSSLEGPEYDIDVKTVHQIILRNVSEDSDAYTYLKPSVKDENGRTDLGALKQRYDNHATRQERINQANSVLETLVYKNERMMPFEVFSSKLQDAIDALQECGRSPHDGDIVDKIWDKILNTEIHSYVEALRVSHVQNPRTYRSILQDIASQIPRLKKQSFRRNVSATQTDRKATRDGECPTNGVFTVDGKLFIGKYPGTRWFNDEVKPYHNQIRKARNESSGKKINNNKYRSNNMKRKNTNINNRTKVGKLHARISELERANTETIKTKDSKIEKMDDEAGTAFGGRNAKKKSKLNQVKTRNRTCMQLKISKQNNHTPDFQYFGRMEMDSHADTIVAGRNTTILNYTSRSCDVMPYNDEYSAKTNVPIVSAAAGYTSHTGENYILILNEALSMPELDHSLINPNQLRSNGIEVQDNPYSEEPMSIISHTDGICIVLLSKGTTIYIDTWAPSQKDLESLPHIELSSKIEWNPEKVEFPSYSRSEREMIEKRNIKSTYRISLSSVEADNTLENKNHTNNGINSNIPFNFNEDVIRISSTKVGPLSEGEIQYPRTFLSSNRHSSVTAEELSNRWCIGLKQAQLTLDATTRKLVRSAIMPLSRRYRVDRMFGIRRLDYEFATDTIDGRIKSVHGSKYAQIFGSKESFVAVYPIATKDECGDALELFVKTYGAPKLLRFDGSREQCGKGSKFQKAIRKYQIRTHITEPQRSNQNPAESVIRELKRKWFRMMYRSNCPVKVWDYGMKYAAAIMNLTASHSGKLNGRTPMELLTGETPDISEYLDHGFYDRVWFREHAGLGPTKLGRFLGVSESVGSLLSYWVLPKSGIPESRTTVQRVTLPEMRLESNKNKFQEYDRIIKKRFKEDRLLPRGDKPSYEEWEEYLHEDDEFREEFLKVYDNPGIIDEEHTPDSYDKYLSSSLMMPMGTGEESQIAKVTKRLKNENGIPIGIAHPNPMLDTRMYEMEYSDGYKVPVSANVIAENFFQQVNDDEQKLMILDEIINHRSKVDQNEHRGQTHQENTKGWEILLLWKDGTSTWSTLKDVKDSYPIEMASYAHRNNLENEPAFSWWCPYVRMKQTRICSKLKSKYWQRTHKYGIRIPKTVKEAIQIDNENGNTLWWDAILLEMKNVRPAFKRYDGDVRKLIGYQRITCHFVFDVKLGENFRRKARLVGGGHKTETPSVLTYSSVVSRDSVRILLLLAALNDIDILACDIQNAYLTAKCREKIYTIAGPEFGSEEGCTMTIEMALYGLKSSGAAFRSKLAGVIHDLGFRPSLADPDVWMRASIKKSGMKYYEYILCYVDDVLVMSEEPEEIIEGIKAVFKLKGDKAELPSMYLGASLEKVETPNGTKCWSMSPDKYVSVAVENVENKLKRQGKKLPTRCVTPTTYKYRPEEDESEELDAESVTYFQEMIGVLRWSIEIGRIDILLEVSLLSTQLACPRVGHMEQVLHIFGYLKKNPKRKIYLDPNHPVIGESRFTKFDWEDFYFGAKEVIGNHMPEPRGNAMTTHCFVDADHAADKISRKSHTGILIFGNKAPLIAYSKKQNGVQGSTFGSEFIAMRQAVELVQALRYKLRQFGVPIDGPTNMFCDNEAVYKNVAHPDSTLRKKHHSVAFHQCREAVASGMIRVAKENTETNLADLFTKPLSSTRREKLLDGFMY